MDQATVGGCWKSLLAVTVVAGLAGPACGGRDHAIYPRSKADAAVEKPTLEAGAPAEATGAAGPSATDADDAPAGPTEVTGPAGAAGASPTDAHDAPADLPIDVGATLDAAASTQPDAADSGSTGTAGWIPSGKTCQRDVDCATGHCREGLCCDTTCADKCYSCLAAKTGKPEGTCAPVKSGLSHSSDCPAADPSTCGLDGTCDGLGGCQVFSSATVCGAETCPPTGSTHTAAAKCDGNGSCKAGTKTSCAAYACAVDGVHCRTTCTSDPDCSESGYCDSGVCKPRVAPGSPCNRGTQCTSALCGGLCCNPGEPCLCTQQSTFNVFANAGFDKDLSGWDVFDATWANLDVEKCPFSGSLYSPTASGYPRKCARISPGTKYYAGLSLYLVGSGGATCEMTFYDDANCLGNETLRTSLFSSESGDIGKWNHYLVEMDGTSTSKSAFLDCDVNYGYIDQIFLTPVPGAF